MGRIVSDGVESYQMALARVRWCQIVSGGGRQAGASRSVFRMRCSSSSTCPGGTGSGQGRGESPARALGLYSHLHPWVPHLCTTTYVPPPPPAAPSPSSISQAQGWGRARTCRVKTALRFPDCMRARVSSISTCHKRGSSKSTCHDTALVQETNMRTGQRGQGEG